MTQPQAARMHNVVPRALGIAIVAAPERRHDIVLRDRDGVIHFVVRDTDTIDAELMTTETRSVPDYNTRTDRARSRAPPEPRKRC